MHRARRSERPQPLPPETTLRRALAAVPCSAPHLAPTAVSPWNFGQTQVSPASGNTPSEFTVGAVNDPQEHEAHALATRALQPEGQSPFPPPTNNSPATAFDHQPAPPLVSQALRSGGQPLDPGARHWMESRFGHDFSHVRIHSSDSAAQSAGSLGALAYTVGGNIVFGRDQYAPHTELGRGLLAHELAHVVQGGKAPGQPRSGARASDPASGPADAAPTPVVRRQPDHHAAPSFGLGNTPQFTVGGHTLAGDRRAVDYLLNSQLTVGPYLQPAYLGSPMSFAEIVNLLHSAAPLVAMGELQGLVQIAWSGKLAAVRQLPALFPSTINLPIPNGANLPDSADAAAQAPSQAGSAPADPVAQPSAGSQLTINLTRGSGPPVGGSMQRQYTFGDNIQAVFQDSMDLRGGTYQVMGGGQALTPNLVHSQIVQLQPFVQLLAGLSRLPGNFSASMTVQYSMGLQLTLKFSLVTIQVTAGFQETLQGGQSQPAFIASAMIGPTTPGPDGSQQAGNWWLRAGSLPQLVDPTPNPAPGVALPPGFGLSFGGRVRIPYLDGGR